MATYKDSGVDINAGTRFVEEIVESARKTYRPEVLSGIGGFGALFALDLQNYKHPILVSSTDGVGTKLRIAIEMGSYDGIGQDLVGMCVNDIACSGAEPLFFLDYFATGRLEPKEHAAIVKGIARACGQVRCSLIGGETAEMPGMYHGKDFDLAGFAVGIVERDDIIDGSSVAIGNSVIGVASSGFHSNGYSLVRSICTENQLSWDQKIPEENRPLGETLLVPTRLYPTLITQLRKDSRILAIAHITGGGITENLPRVLPRTCQARINTTAWPMPAVMRFIQSTGKIDDGEMRRVFNCGIGLTLVVPKDDAAQICQRIRGAGESAWVIGEVVRRPVGGAGVAYV